MENNVANESAYQMNIWQLNRTVKDEDAHVEGVMVAGVVSSSFVGVRRIGIRLGWRARVLRAHAAAKICECHRSAPSLNIAMTFSSSS